MERIAPGFDGDYEDEGRGIAPGFGGDEGDTGLGIAPGFDNRSYDEMPRITWWQVLMIIGAAFIAGLLLGEKFWK